MLKSALLPRYEFTIVTPRLQPLQQNSTRWCN